MPGNQWMRPLWIRNETGIKSDPLLLVNREDFPGKQYNLLFISVTLSIHSPDRLCKQVSSTCFTQETGWVFFTGKNFTDNAK